MKKQEPEVICKENGDPPEADPIKDHLHALATEEDLPNLALAFCAARFEEAAPTLRELLTRAADGEALGDQDATLLFRGLYVLAVARDTKSWPVLLRLLRRPIEELDCLLGDAVTESLALIAASMFDGDVKALFEAIVDMTADQFVRDALLSAVTFLTSEGRIDRERMRAFLIDLHEQRRAPNGDYLWVGWTESIGLLGFREQAVLVEDAFAQGRIDPNATDWNDFEEKLRAAESEPDDIGRFKRANLGYIDDVVEALDWTRGRASSGANPSGSYLGNVLPASNEYRHVGRNDSCPCGSGRKFKKCCLDVVDVNRL